MDTKLFARWEEARNLPDYITARPIHTDGQFLIVLLCQTIKEDDHSWEDVYTESARVDSQGNWTFFRHQAVKIG